jgi:hypothetical protein
LWDLNASEVLVERDGIYQGSAIDPLSQTPYVREEAGTQRYSVGTRQSASAAFHQKMEESPDYLKTSGHPVCYPIWLKILCRGDLKNVQPIIAKPRKTNDRRWSRVASTRDLPTIAFFRAGALLRRSVPVPGILATADGGDY